MGKFSRFYLMDRRSDEERRDQEIEQLKECVRTRDEQIRLMTERMAELYATMREMKSKK
jgi:hypothetical protein